MTAGEYGTPTHYLKGKDLKQQGDCLVYCYTRRIETIFMSDRVETVLPTSDRRFIVLGEDNTPEGFEKW